MELGGTAPFIVFDDADLEAALEGAMAQEEIFGPVAPISRFEQESEARANDTEYGSPPTSTPAILPAACV